MDNTTIQTKSIIFVIPATDEQPKAKVVIDITLKGIENGSDYCGRSDDRYRLSISGSYRDVDKNESYGQIRDTFSALKVCEDQKEIQQDILTLWKEHLNDMHAGTREQEAFVDEHLEHYDYTKACEILKEHGMYEVEVNGAPYKYGHAWLYWKLSNTAISLLEKYDFIYHGSKFTTLIENATVPEFIGNQDEVVETSDDDEAQDGN